MTHLPTLAHATEFLVNPDADWHDWVTVRRMVQRDNSILWGVYWSSSVWSKSAETFIYEPIPSSRTDEFIADCRFATLGEAWAVAESAARSKTR